MHIPTWATISILSLAFVSVVYVLAHLKPWREYSRQAAVCGYLPPPPTKTAFALLRMLARVVLFFQVGKLKIVGAENLRFAGVKVITANHGHFVDRLPFVLMLDNPARYMAAGGVFDALWGLGGLFAGKTGCFCARLDKGKGGPARTAAVEALVTGQAVVMFPEGWAYMNGEMGSLKKGAVRIAREAAEKLGVPSYLVPGYMRYGKYPGKWILKFSPGVQYLIVLLGWFWYRRGLTVVIGKPVPSTSLPSDDEAATEMLRNKIVDLDPLKLVRPGEIQSLNQGKAI